MNKYFRFQDFDIWKSAIDFADQMFEICETLDKQKHYRFAQQLRAASLSISNNIAEGSGAMTKRDFANFLNIARKSAFECANMLLFAKRRNIKLKEKDLDKLLNEIYQLSIQIYKFRKSIT